MLEDFEFTGFPPECPRFYRALARHNDRAWFARHKPEYQEHVLRPAQAFVVEMGARLRRLAPELRFDPRTGGSGSIFRIYRDTRFSKDKRPFKTHLGIFFWEGERNDGHGFYFHLEPPRLQLYVGCYTFGKPQLQAWRESVADPEHGAALAALLRRATRGGACELGGEGYQRVPAGYAKDHPRAALLKHDSVWLRVDEPLPAALHERRLLDWCLARFRRMAPLHFWLSGMRERAGI